MRKLALIAVTLLVAAPAALADECRSNAFQPTFVRHNSVAPRVWFVEPNGSFTLMASPDQAQATCRARGVRQLIGGRSCAQRNWGDFACGCNIAPSPNATCARFQNYLRTISRTGPVLGPGMMNNVNIPGADIANFLSNDPAVCRSACQNNANCVAWTWVRPGIQAASGRCWLKNSVPSQVPSTCCVSAIERRTPTGTMLSPSDDQFCRDIYSRADAENRTGNAARDRGDVGGARVHYQRALQLFRQGAANRRCTRFHGQFANAAATVERNIARVGQTAPGPAGTIAIVSALYGMNCPRTEPGRTKDVTQHVARACNGRAQCSYYVNHRTIGDPAVGCRKDFRIQYRCSGGGAKQAFVLPEASGRSALLSCP